MTHFTHLNKLGNINTSGFLNIEKGKKVPIGTIHNGYKKIAEGKWQKVSEHELNPDDLSKKDSVKENSEAKSRSSEKGGPGSGRKQEAFGRVRKEDVQKYFQNHGKHLDSSTKSLAYRDEYETTVSKNQFGNLSMEIKHKEKGHTAYSGKVDEKSELYQKNKHLLGEESKKSEEAKKQVSSDLEKAFSILSESSFSNQIEKGGKRATIGEVRTWGGEKWVKHQDGWVHVHPKTGKATIEKPGGKREEASEDHTKYYKEHIDRHDRESLTKQEQKQAELMGEEYSEVDADRIANGKSLDKSLDKYKALGDREKLEVDGVTYKLELIKHPKDRYNYDSQPTFSVKLTHPSTGEIKVMPNAIKFHSGYDQGPLLSSKQQWYADVAGYGTGNGGGQSSTSSVNIDRNQREHLAKLFSSKKHYQESYHKYQDSIVTFPKGTKAEEIKRGLDN